MQFPRKMKEKEQTTSVRIRSKDLLRLHRLANEESLLRGERITMLHLLADMFDQGEKKMVIKQAAKEMLDQQKNGSEDQENALAALF